MGTSSIPQDLVGLSEAIYDIVSFIIKRYLAMKHHDYKFNMLKHSA